MKLWGAWQLMLLLCATSFGKTSERVAPTRELQSLGLQTEPQRFLVPWKQKPGCKERKPARGAGTNLWGSLLFTPPEGATGPQQPGPYAPRNRLIPAPRGAVLVRRVKDLSAYSWNSFGLNYRKRLATQPASRCGGIGRG